MFQTRLPTPFAVLGIRCTPQTVVGVEFLPPGTPLLPPQTAMTQRVSEALAGYLHNPATPIDLPLALEGTAFQQRVWQALRAIPPGETRTYGEIAKEIGSGPRAVANACGANPIALFVPCHRVVAAHGLGGFMQGKDTASLDIKHWLLAHERGTSANS